MSVTSYVDERPFTEYVIAVRRQSSTTNVRHRFSDFLRLHQHLGLTSHFPCTKRWFHPRAVKTERTHKLDAYIQKLAEQPETAQRHELLSFLGISHEGSSEDTVPKPPSTTSATPTAALATAGSDPVASLRSKLGQVVGLHSDEEWESAVRLTTVMSPGARKLVLVVDFTATW